VKAAPAQLLVDTITPEDLVALRKKAKLTQVEAATLVGYSRRGWQDIESGKNAVTSATLTLFLLATDTHPSYKLADKKR
jgi:transcriptional regulator with XRE-family HTH domain